MCAAADPLAATGGRHYGLESQQESVCPGTLSQTSTNQQKQMGVCLAGQWKVQRSIGTKSFFSLSYLLKEPLTRAHHFRKCFSSISYFSVLSFPHSSFLSAQHLNPFLTPRSPEGSSACSAPSHRSLNLHLTDIFDRRSMPLTV